VILNCLFCLAHFLGIDFLGIVMTGDRPSRLGAQAVYRQTFTAGFEFGLSMATRWQ
jgi:hypothetical protein